MTTLDDDDDGVMEMRVRRRERERERGIICCWWCKIFWIFLFFETVLVEFLMTDEVIVEMSWMVMIRRRRGRGWSPRGREWRRARK